MSETETITITDDNKKDTMKLVAGRKILKSVTGPMGTILTVGGKEKPPKETAGEDLWTLKRPELDVIAEDLGMDPSKYSNMAKLREAIEEKRK